MKIEIIAQELQKPQYSELVRSQNYPAIANSFNNKALIFNPNPQGNIPKPITILELFQLVTPQEALAIYQVSGLKQDIDHAITNNLRDNLLALLAVASLLLSPESVASIQDLIEEEIPDPNYQSQIPGTSRAEELGIYPVYDSEVQSALNPQVVSNAAG